MSKPIVLACSLAMVVSTVWAAENAPASSRARPMSGVAVAATPAKTQSPAASPLKTPASVEAPAPKLPAMTAAEIVDRNVAARGGLPSWRAVNTLTMEGKVDAGGKPNVELPFVMKMKRGHKSRLELAFRDQTALQVYDGAQGWKVRPFLNRDEVEPYTASEAKAASSWDDFDGPLIDYAKKGTKVELAGTETVEDSPTYKLKLTLRNGEQRYVWIDGKNFLERRIDGEPRRLDGKVHKVAVYYRSFKTENGLTTPRVLETVVDGIKVTRKMTITKVVANEPMADALFQKPQLAMATAPGR